MMKAKVGEQIPTNIWAYKTQDNQQLWMTPRKVNDLELVHGESKEYTLVHNNPDYHVIKKSDVQGGLMEELDSLYGWLNECYYDNNAVREAVDKIHNALIAQSDMVIIPMDVLEGMKWKQCKKSRMGLDERYFYCADKVNKAIDRILNYKKEVE